MWEHAGDTKLIQISRQWLDWILPSRCLGCGDLTASAAFDANCLPTLCADCFSELAPQLGVACKSCGAPLGPWANSAGKCPHCRGRKFRFKSVTCLGMYDGLLRRLLVEGKWSRASHNLRTLAATFSAARGETLRHLGVDSIVPIPQFWHRRLWRNFNPATLVAAEVSKLLNSPVETRILCRSRHTPPQKRASLAERTAIQQGSFRIRDRHLITDKRLLLVDDVMTTGATCNEATRILLDAGAKECHVAVVARVSATAS